MSPSLLDSVMFGHMWSSAYMLCVYMYMSLCECMYASLYCVQEW